MLASKSDAVALSAGDPGAAYLLSPNGCWQHLHSGLQRAPGRVDSRLRGNDKKSRHPGRSEVEARGPQSGGSIRASLQRAPGRVGFSFRGMTKRLRSIHKQTWIPQSGKRKVINSLQEHSCRKWTGNVMCYGLAMGNA